MPTSGLNTLSTMAGVPFAMQQLLDQQKESYDRNKAQINILKSKATPSPESDANERWAAMATAASKVPPMVGGFGALLASIGGAYGKAISEQEQRNFEREALIAKLMESNGSGTFGAGSMTALTQAILNPYVNVPGIGLVRRTDAEVKLPSNMTSEYTKLYNSFYKAAVDQKMPNPEEWARRQAEANLKAPLRDANVAGGRVISDIPSNEDGTETPSVNMLPVGTVTEEGKITRDTSSWIKKLEQEEKRAVFEKDYGRALEIKKARQALESAQPTTKSAPQSTPTSGITVEEPTARIDTPTGNLPQGLQYKDSRKEKFKEEWGAKEAATLEKALTDSSKVINTTSNLISTLNTLEGLFNVDNMPEGKFAPIFMESQSALKSMGVDIKSPTGPAQVATALANEMALRLRTGSGENLMPGQMSNFDAQLLISMAPTLSQTKEGRNMLLNFMREAADSQRRIAEAAQNFAANNNGMLTPEWRKIAADMERKEMAKRELARRRIMRQFAGEQYGGK